MLVYLCVLLNCEVFSGVHCVHCVSLFDSDFVSTRIVLACLDVCIEIIICAFSYTLSIIIKEFAYE